MNLNLLKTVLGYLVCITYIAGYIFKIHKDIILPIGVIFFVFYIIVSLLKWSKNKKST